MASTNTWRTKKICWSSSHFFHPHLCGVRHSGHSSIHFIFWTQTFYTIIPYESLFAFLVLVVSEMETHASLSIRSVFDSNVIFLLFFLFKWIYCDCDISNKRFDNFRVFEILENLSSELRLFQQFEYYFHRNIM